MTTTLTIEQKRQLFHDGYIVLKGAVPGGLVEAAQARIEAAEKGPTGTSPVFRPRDESLSPAAELTDLVNKSTVTPILTEVMGTFDLPSRVHVGVNPISEPHVDFTAAGYREKDLPYFGCRLHAEGLCTMLSPQERIEGTPGEIYKKMIATGLKGDIGRSADVIGINTDPLFQDPEMTLAVGSFTAFVIVALNEQFEDGVGQTAVIPGGHHVLEGFYRWQYQISGKIGPEGPGWPRFDYNAPNGAGHVLLPDAVQKKFIEMDSEPPETTPDGRPWPRPTPIRLGPGDAAITIFQMPHTGTRNQFGTESRKNIIFRIRNKRRQPDKVVTGVSDHPDRGQFGEWLDYEPGNDPWQRSKHALTHMWDEWEGMRDIVAAEQPTLTPIDFGAVS